MALEITLTISKSTLSMLEDATLELQLRNTADTPILLVPAGSEVLPPLFRVTRRETGETRACYHRFSPGQISRFPETLGPGATATWRASLASYIQFEEPGQYEIVAEIPWNEGEGTARSRPVPLTIGAVAPMHLVLSKVESPNNMLCLAFWTENRQGEYWLHRAVIETTNQPKIVEAAEVAKLPTGIEPFVSDAPNLDGTHDSWVAWLEHKTLHAVFVNRANNPSAIGGIELPNMQIQILRNPFMTAGRELEIPLWLSTPATGRAKLQLAVTGPRGDFRADAEIFMPVVNPPVWSHSAFLKSLERRVYLAIHQEGEWRVYCAAWADAREIKPIKLLLGGRGHLAGGSLALLPDDTVAGVFVIQPEGAKGHLEFIRWSQDPGGAFAEQSREEVAAPEAVQIDRLILRIDNSRQPHALLKSLDGKWFYRAPAGAFVPVGGEVGESRGTVGLLFSSMQTPILVYTKAPQGINFADPSGRFPPPVIL